MFVNLKSSLKTLQIGFQIDELTLQKTKYIAFTYQNCSQKQDEYKPMEK